MKTILEIFAYMLALLLTLVAVILPFFDAFIHARFNPAIPKPLAWLLWWSLRLFLWLVIAAIVYVTNHY